MSKIYRDTERNEYVSKDELVFQFHSELTDEDRHGRTFAQYLQDCLSKNGFLEELKIC